MPWSERNIAATDGHDIACFEMIPDGLVVGQLHIIHGMAEHGSRYKRLAEKLSQSGWHIIAHDHRGHGSSWDRDEPYGHLADSGGWDLATYDIEIVRQELAKPRVPYFLLGHSAGALLSLSYAQNFGDHLSGMVLSALAPDQPVLRLAGSVIGGFQVLIGKRRDAAQLLTKLTFGKFNNAFKPARTSFDWLSNLEPEVDKYVSDPLCGGECTVGFFMDLSNGVKQIWNKRNLQRLPSQLPLFLISGEEDPVVKGRSGAESVRLTLENYLNELDQHIYDGARHEILNDKVRDDVERDVLGWLQKHLPLS